MQAFFTFFLIFVNSGNYFELLYFLQIFLFSNAFPHKKLYTTSKIKKELEGSDL